MTSSWAKNKHDIGITDVGGNGLGSDMIGMMLARKPDGTPAYEEYDGKYLVDQFATGQPSQVNTDPEEELIISQDDWRSGFGLEYCDLSDPKRYFSSIGMDLRFRGRAICGPTPTTATEPTITATNEANLDWETWTDASTPGTWTEDMPWTREATIIHGGTYSGLCSYATATSAKAASQSVAWNTEYQGRTFHLRGWGRYALGASEIKFAIYDGVSRSYTTALTGSADTWEQSGWVSHTVDASATELTLEIWLKGAGGGSNFYIDDMNFIDPTDGKMVDLVDFNSELYGGMGNVLVKLNAGGTGFDYVYSFPATITDLQPFQVSGTDYLFIFIGTSDAYWYMTTAEAFTESTATNKKYQYAAWVNTTADTMYANDGANTIRSTVNPLNGGTAWSSQTIVGAAEHSITKLLDNNGALYVMKEDMPYYLDSSGNVQKDLAPELVSLTASTSGKNSLLWKKNLYIPCGDQGLLETDGTTNTFRNPSSYCTNLSDFVGRVQALGADEQYLYAIVDNSTKVEILAGRLETIDSTTAWVWHPIAEITLAGCETATVSTVYQKRLWITSTATADSIYYIPLPVTYGNIESDTNRKFKTGVTFETPWLHGNFRAENKAWIKITLTMGHTYNANDYFTVKYKKLGDSSWTTIGNFKGSATSMVETKYIDTTNKPFSAMMKFQFTAVTGATTRTPVLLSYDVRTIMYPTMRRLIHCVVRCADEITRRDGTIERKAYSTIKTALDNARDNAVWPVAIKDIDGTDVDVKFLPVPKSLQRLMITSKEKGRQDERHYQLLLMEVPLS